jgi:uridylate kinase
LLKKLTFQHVVEKKLAVMDLTAVAMLAESPIKIHVFNMEDPEIIDEVLLGKDIGSVISKE